MVLSRVIILNTGKLSRSHYSPLSADSVELLAGYQENTGSRWENIRVANTHYVFTK
jgi:hypothetical protein